MRFLEPFEPFRVPLARCPSPLEVHDGLSRELGVRLLLKREDLLDDLASGHKVRKLEYVIGHALRQGADMLVTAGSAQSNQCKAVAYAARRLGLHSRLVFCGDAAPAEARGNYLIDLILGTRQHWVGRAEWPVMGEHLAAAAEAERQAGRRPWVIPPGASDWWARWAASASPPSWPGRKRRSGSASTSWCCRPARAARRQDLWWAGRCCAGRGARSAWRCWANKATSRICTRRSLPIWRAMPGWTCRPASSSVEVEDRATGGGYGAFSAVDLDEMLEVARRHALVLDPVYMMKTLGGLRRLVADGAVAQGSTVVLVLTGGQHGLFGLEGDFAAHLRSGHPGWFTGPASPPPSSGG